jgi:hypothetical protein
VEFHVRQLTGMERVVAYSESSLKRARISLHSSPRSFATSRITPLIILSRAIVSGKGLLKRSSARTAAKVIVRRVRMEGSCCVSLSSPPAMTSLVAFGHRRSAACGSPSVAPAGGARRRGLGGSGSAGSCHLGIYNGHEIDSNTHKISPLLHVQFHVCFASQGVRAV